MPPRPTLSLRLKPDPPVSSEGAAIAAEPEFRPRGGPTFCRLDPHWPGTNFALVVGPTEDPELELTPLNLSLVLWHPESGTRLVLPGDGDRTPSEDDLQVSFTLADSAALVPGAWEAHVYAGSKGGRRHWLWGSFVAQTEPEGA